MKITIKKLKTMRGMDWPAVDCDVCIAGKTIAIAHDDGSGGGLYIEATGTDHDNYIHNRELLDKAEAFIKKTENMPLDEYIDNMIDASISAKNAKKTEREYQKGICVGTPEHFHVTGWKGVKSLKVFAEDERSKLVLQKAINDVKKNLKPGEKILNATLLKEIGLKV